jgi:hypothetical protein
MDKPAIEQGRVPGADSNDEVPASGEVGRP